MFASLKNKIKEETGSDLTKLPILNNPSQKLTSTSKGRHSRQGSGSSIGSSSFDGITEERVSSSLSVIKQDSFENKPPEEKVLVSKEIRRLEKQEDEWRKRLQKKEEEWVKKLENKEEEWKKQLEEKQWDWKRSLELLEKEKSVLEEEKREVVKQKLSLEESLKVAEEYKRKVFQYQEDIDQLEGFQTQEMSKIKHLLLVKEQEVAEMVNALKESTQQVEMLRAEVTRLRRYEEELNNVQEKAEEERLQLQSRVEEIQKRTKSIETDHAELAVMLRDEKKEHDVLKEEVALLREMLEKERARYTDLNLAFDKERQEKDTILMRNAQVNQQMELARQELRAQEQEATELHSKVVSLETAQGDRIKELDRRRMEVENLSKRIEELEIVQHDKQAAGEQEQKLRGGIAELEDQLTEKNKTIRILQQRLGDMKKTLQRELRLPPQSLDNSAGVDVEGGVAITAILTPTSSKHVQPKHTSNHRTKEEEDDVNFKYLKHVLIKFLTSREYEAQHLTRAVATLLRFSPEEERLLRETLDWKMSWFGTRPSLGFGQTSKTIPHS